MHVHRSSDYWICEAPAKLNLFFEVLGKRADGYHEIVTCLCPIQLYDTLRFRPAKGRDISFYCRWAAPAGEGAKWGDLPGDSRNLALKAILLLREKAGITAGGELFLVKRIPSAAGLGGASADAVAALRLANAAWGLEWSDGELLQLACQLGSDLAAFFVPGPIVCRGRGELVQPLVCAQALHFVVARPAVGLSTAEVYRNCRVPSLPRSIEPLLEALTSGTLSQLGLLLFNRLEETASTLCPWVGWLREKFLYWGCVGVGMTGSGTSVFALCEHAAHARMVASRVRAGGLPFVVAVRSGS